MSGFESWGQLPYTCGVGGVGAQFYNHPEVDRIWVTSGIHYDSIAERS